MPERFGQFLRQTVRPVLVPRVTAFVLEGQDRDGGDPGLAEHRNVCHHPIMIEDVLVNPIAHPQMPILPPDDSGEPQDPDMGIGLVIPNGLKITDAVVQRQEDAQIRFAAENAFADEQEMSSRSRRG